MFKATKYLKYSHLSFCELFSRHTAQSAKITFNHIDYSISQRKRFIQLRFGDGDIFLSYNQYHRNQQSNVYIQKEMKQALTLKDHSVLKSIPIHSARYGFSKNMSVGSHLQTDRDAKILLALTHKHINQPDIPSSVPFHYMIQNEPDLFVKFLAQLRSYNSLFFGSSKNSSHVLSKVLSPDKFLTVPHRNAYSSADDIYQSIEKFIIADESGYPIIIGSAGALTKVIFKRLALQYPDNKFALIDLGSVIDIFHGRNDWSWAKNSEVNINYIITKVLA